MSSIVISGDSSGSISLQAPAVAGTNTITLPAATGELSMLGGSGQTWQDVTASRAAGTTYTNSTGKPIMVFVRGASSGSGGSFTITVNGATIGSTTQGYTSNALNSASFIVPNGQTYSITATSNTLSLWTELR